MVWSDPSTAKKYSFADTFKLALGQKLSPTDAYQSAINWQNKGGKPIEDSAVYSPINPSIPAPSSPAPAPYVPGAAPQQMDWETAFSKAQGRVNPTYDSLRGKAETTYSKARESIPQLLAARFGMSGLRGGRRQSAEYGATQNENQGISELEGQRQQALNSTASAIQNDDFSTAMNLYNATEALRAKSAGDAYQKWRDTILDQQSKDETDYSRALKQRLLEREDERFGVQDSQWDKTFGLQQGSLENDPEYRQILLERAGVGLDTDRAQLYNTQNPSTRTGGGGSSGSTMSAAQVLDDASAMAKADPRLADGVTTFPDGKDFFTLAQLIDAYRNQILNQYSNNNQGRYNAVSDEDIWNSL